MLRLRWGVPEVIAPLYNTCIETSTDKLAPAQDAPTKAISGKDLAMLE
jgi:hypothetical protein